MSRCGWVDDEKRLLSREPRSSCYFRLLDTFEKRTCIPSDSFTSPNYLVEDRWGSLRIVEDRWGSLKIAEDRWGSFRGILQDSLEGFSKWTRLVVPGLYLDMICKHATRKSTSWMQTETRFGLDLNVKQELCWKNQAQSFTCIIDSILSFSRFDLIDLRWVNAATCRHFPFHLRHCCRILPNSFNIGYSVNFYFEIDPISN